ncbi:hypothetical protein COOONC_01262 [Cooperia oncophora]
MDISPFPPPHKPMLYCTDSPPNEMAPPYLRASKNVNNTLVSPPAPNVQLPAIVCTPVRPAPKRPVNLTLDSPIPVPADATVASEYVPMNPPKAMKIAQKEDDLRLPAISLNRLKISDPIPLIVAGKAVNVQAKSPPNTSAHEKPSQTFIATLEDTLRAQTLGRNAKLSPGLKNKALPKPPVPDRSEKPALRIPKDSPKERLYDVPADS